MLALDQFAKDGYDAASLNDIAIRAGIKKPSLYAHFESKDKLYETTLQLALRGELSYLGTQFVAARVKTSAVIGHQYLNDLQNRYANSSALRFLLRAAFYPPPPLRELVSAGFKEYLESIRAYFQSTLKDCFPEVCDSTIDLLAEAYMAMIDSLHVELIYGDEHAYKCRFAALGRLFQSINMKKLGE